jgi:phosphoadenosine phosphosulfate reductase
VARPKHGKEIFRWCDECGSLILDEGCSTCGSPSREFSVSLPADIRPCTGAGVDTVKDVFERKFGTSSFLDGRLIFLNRIAGEDRTDEIVVEGEVIGTLRFEIITKEFNLDLKLAGASILTPLSTKGIVKVKPPSGHLKGRSLPGSEIIEIKGGFEIGDPLVVLSGNLVCAGVARTSSKDALRSRKALGIRDAGKGRIKLPQRDLSWMDFVRCNEPHLRKLESKAVSDIRSFLGNRKENEITVSFSGGKDSLACYALARKAAGDVTLLFANTGLEFPETVEYIRRFASKNGVRLIEGSPPTTFWNQFPTFGPPAKDFRWCCKVCKLAPITSIIEDNYPEGVITLEGNRIYESFARSRIGFVERNPFVPGQINLNPVREWRAIEVWGYIWLKGLEYNPLYDKDFQRIGCYLCPACLASEWEATRRTHPELWRRWNDDLLQWSKEVCVDEEYVDHGFWRWKNLPPKMRILAETLELRMPQVRAEQAQMKMVKGASPCAAGGYSIEGVISLPVKRDFSRVAEALKVLGKVRYSDEYQIALVRKGDATLKVFGGGQVTAIASTREEADDLFDLGVKSLLRAQMCSECGICVKSCPREALEISGGPKVDESRCTHCGKCIESCVVAHYFDKLVA